MLENISHFYQNFLAENNVLSTRVGRHALLQIGASDNTIMNLAILLGDKQKWAIITHYYSPILYQTIYQININQEKEIVTISLSLLCRITTNTSHTFTRNKIFMKLKKLVSLEK